MIARRRPLFRLAGIQIHADASWLFIAFLIVWSLATGVFPATYSRLAEGWYWLMGVAGALGLFASIVVHELAHSLVARKFGLPIRGITLFLFGGVAEMEDEPPSPRAEFFMAAAGPAASIVIGAALFGVHRWLVSIGGPAVLRGLAGYLWTINLILAGFNLVPAFPLDGGRIFRAALWKWKKSLEKSTRIASYVGTGFGFVLMAFGVYSMIQGNLINGLWWILIGSFLRTSSQASYRNVLVNSALRDRVVRDVMYTECVAVPYQTRVDSFVEDFAQRYGRDLFAVTRQGTPDGYVTAGHVRKIPRQAWTTRIVADIAAPLADHMVIDPATTVADAWKRMRTLGVPGLVAISEGEPVGVLSRRDLLSLTGILPKRRAFRWRPRVFRR